MSDDFEIPPYFFVFDVESIGLHGEGFAAGWTIINKEGKEVDYGCVAVDRRVAAGRHEDREWVDKNIPEIEITHPSKRLMRESFWRSWTEWKAKGAVMAADCPWPVEARFLAECVDDDRGRRGWDGPYPFIDIASVLLACGKDPLATYGRNESELPAHDPLADARQSARLLAECILIPGQRLRDGRGDTGTGGFG
jgi:hypothetical protein